MEVFDKDGNPVENVFSQEELDKKLTEAKEQWEKDNPAPAPEPEPELEPTPADEMPEWAKSLAEKVDRLSGNETTRTLTRFTEGLDADKQADVKAKFDALSGYDDTPEGLQRRAEDAYLLATGERFDQSNTNMQNIAATSSGANADVTKTDKGYSSPQDSDIQKALGITSEDIEKFGKK